jgi:hypothetical protein
MTNPAGQREATWCLFALLAFSSLVAHARAQEPGSSSGSGQDEPVIYDATVGYIDPAQPRTRFRLRYDSAYDMNRPDRGEFFFASVRELSFHPHGIDGGGIYFDPRSRGPEQMPQHVNYQEASPYLEYALNRRFSLFAELPFRYLEFRGNQEDSPEAERMPNGKFFPEPLDENTVPPNNYPFGVSDLQFGFKFAFLADSRRYLTLQFRTYLPTGDPALGLGTGHASLEPGLLFHRQLTERWAIDGEVLDWIPIGGGKSIIDGKRFASNIVIYGLGTSYTVYSREKLRVAPVAEFVGWTTVDGLWSFFGPVHATPPPGIVIPVTHGVAEAAGDTIVNAKFGVRTYFGDGHDIYVGFGRALTGSRWYQEILRVEYRYSF